MAKTLPKRRFLVTKSKPLKEHLQEEALFYKTYDYAKKTAHVYDFDTWVYVLEEYKKELKGLNLLLLIAQSDVPLSQEIQSLPEVSDDRRYTKEFIERFGNPAKSEFNIQDVFEKLESIGASRMDLHFSAGMSKIKVFQVLLYRQHQLFLAYYERYLDNEIGYEYLQSTHKDLINVLKLSADVFQKKIVKKLLRDAQDLYMLLNHGEKFERYTLNFELFVTEKSNFFEGKNPHEPLYDFVKRRLKKMLELEDKRVKNLYQKVIVDRDFINTMDEIECLVKFFGSIFSKKEAKQINSKILTLKTYDIRT